MIADWTKALIREFPTAILTGITTIVLILLLSVLLGASNNEHRVSSRCNAYHMQEMIFELAEQLGTPLDRADHPVLDMDGIDCSLVQDRIEPEAH